MAMVNVVTIAVYIGRSIGSGWSAWSKDRRPPSAACYSRQMNRVNSRSGSTLLRWQHHKHCRGYYYYYYYYWLTYVLISLVNHSRPDRQRPSVLSVAGDSGAVVRSKAGLGRAASVTDAEVRSVYATCCRKLPQRNRSKPEIPLGFPSLTYKERLSVLGLESLELRRLRTDILLMYKILFGIIDVDVSRSLFVLRPNDRPTRGHSYKLLQEHCVTDTRKRFFSQRVASIWNSLPASIIDFTSFIAFDGVSSKCKFVNFSEVLSILCFTNMHWRHVSGHGSCDSQQTTRPSRALLRVVVCYCMIIVVCK